MNLHVWKRVVRATGHCHHKGGFLVVASDVHEARELLRTTPPADYSPPDLEAPEWGADGSLSEECGAFTQEPDLIVPCDLPRQIIVFPDAGCC